MCDARMSDPKTKGKKKRAVGPGANGRTPLAPRFDLANMSSTQRQAFKVVQNMMKRKKPDESKTLDMLDTASEEEEEELQPEPETEEDDVPQYELDRAQRMMENSDLMCNLGLDTPCGWE